MKIFNCYVLLPLVIVIGVSKAQNCTNSTSETCCRCTEEQCGDSCLSGFYRLDPPYPSDTGCSLVSTTPSPSSSTDTSNTTSLTPSGDISTQSTNNGDTTAMSIEDSQNSTLCLRNCPQGFYGNNDTGACMECSDGCNSCIDNSTCSPTTTQNTTPTSADKPADNTTYIIIGGVCGGVAVIVIVVVVVIVVVCRKRKQSRRQKRKDNKTPEAINQVPTGIESKDEEQEIGKPDHHIYVNTAQLTKDWSTKIQQNHDKLLRYTPDPTQSSNLMSSKDNEQFEVDQLPLAPAPPKTTKSKRLTKVKKPKPEPISDDVYEPVEPVDSVENDTGAHGDDESIDGEHYENKQVIAQMKSVRKMSHQMNSKDHEEVDYENDLVLKDLKVDSKTEVDQKQEVDPEQEQDYENEEEVEKFRKAEVNPKAEPEHELQDYENETMVNKLRKPEVNLKAEQEHEHQLSILRKPTKDPLTEEEIYENV